MAYLNLAVLSGRLSRPAELRLLPSGDRLVALEVSVPREGARTETVPVAWMAAPPAAADLDTGEEVLVVGRVRRRFWKARGGGTMSSTEILADRVVPLRRGARCRAALAEAVGRLGEAAPPAR